MSECFVSRAGGGSKIYTEKDCELWSNTLTLPPGVVWSDIKLMVGASRRSGNTDVFPFLKEPGGNGFGYFSYYNDFISWNTPAPDATEIKFPSGYGSNYFGYVIIVV